MRQVGDSGYEERVVVKIADDKADNDLMQAEVSALALLCAEASPQQKHLPVIEFIPPAKFAEYKARGEAMGFVHVASGPMVRSSYHADDFDPSSMKC
mgnify:CR=1 FL=1